MTNSMRILGTKIDAHDKTSIKNAVNEALGKKNNIKIFTPNTEIVLRAKRDNKLKDVLENADIMIADGAGIVMASKILGTPLPERLAGIEIGEYIIEAAAKLGLSIFLLGGKQGVADQAKERIAEKHKNIIICGTHYGYFETNGEENEKVLEQIKSASPDILFVCMGFPRQEKWIVENSHNIPSLRLSVGLGGSLDVWSENVKRAPKIFRKLSLEWLWRILHEPRRMSFLFKIPIFLLNVLVEKCEKISKQPK